MDQVSFSSTQFAAVTSPHVAMIGPGEGPTVWVFGVLITLKSMTTGAHSWTEIKVPPGICAPLHIHFQEDETWYVLDGELVWTVGDQEFHAKRGAFIHLPRFVPHAFQNKFEKAAHMLVTFAPAGFEKWFLDVGQPVANVSDPGEAPVLSQDEVKKAAELAKEYALTFTTPAPNQSLEIRLAAMA